jgi:outer membrane protein OmpA-like peptidoglycan-associated protein
MWIVKLNRDTSMAQVSSSIESIYEKLTLLYKKEISKKQIKIKKDLTIELIDKRLQFKMGAYKLTKDQEIFLDGFRKKLLSFLYKNREFIKTLEVNGHTSSEWGTANFTDRYLNNEKLSLNRSYEVISCIFTSSQQKVKLWLSGVLKGSGNSYAKIIKHNNIESKKRSRRVSFKIVLK